MAIKQLYGDRDLNGDVLKNYTFTVFADLAAATAVVGDVFGFAFIADVGSLYYNQTGLAWQPVGSKGAKGDAGIQGIPGVDGNTVLSGAGVPSSGLGVDGNFYIDTTAVEIYGPKTAGAWGSPTSLIGTAGNTILNGIVPPTTEGVDGDFYLDTALMDMYGPKAGGTWPAVPTSLIGPQGIQGIQGIPGIDGGAGPAGPPAAWDVYIGSVSSRTVVAAGPPTLPPVGADPQYHFDSTASLMYKWTSIAWALLTQFPFYYMDRDTGILDVQDNFSLTGWKPVYNFGHTGLTTVIQTVAGAYTATGYAYIPVDSTGGAFTLTLPAAAVDGVVVELKDISGACEQYPVTLTDPQGFDDGTTTFVMDRAYETVQLARKTIGINTRWMIIGVFRKPPDAPGATITTTAGLSAARNQTADVDSTTAAFTLTLPVSPVEEDIVHVKDVTGLCETNPVTLAAAAGFEGATPVLDAPFMELTLVFRGAQWVVVSQYRNAVTTATTLNAAGALVDKRDQTILYDVSGAGFALTLPPTPREGDKVRFKEATGSTNTLTLTGTIDGAVNPTYSTARLVFAIEYLSGAWYRMQ